MANASDYLTSDTRLLFLPGNYSLESELNVENVRSFSMLVWPDTSSKVVIICSHNARFEFKNVSTVTMNGFKFVRCFQNHVQSVDQFQLEHSGFFGNGEAIINGTVLTIDKSSAKLDSVVFIASVEKLETSTKPQLPENCFEHTLSVETMSIVIVLLLKHSNIRITESLFTGNKVDLGAVLYSKFSNDTDIVNTIFVNNSAGQHCNDDCCFNGGIVYASENRKTINIYHSKFEKNIGMTFFCLGDNTYTSAVSIIHSEFVDNTTEDSRVLSRAGFVSNVLVELNRVKSTIHLSEFNNNRAGFAVMSLHPHTENLSNNVFLDNSAVYEIFISSRCTPDLNPSLGSSRCIHCTKSWRRDLIGIVIAGFVAGIALVILMLALNMTVAVGTLNGLLFYANIVAANADTYFQPFTAPNFVTIFVSWINLDIGFDTCFLVRNDNPELVFNEHTQLHIYKALLQLAFPIYVILLVITAIVASECSSKFARIIGKGNPVAVLATMILLSYSKFSNAVLASFSLLHGKPALLMSQNLAMSLIQSMKLTIHNLRLSLSSCLQ